MTPDTDQHADIERAKYEKMYTHEGYKSHTQSVVMAKSFLARIDYKAGEYLADFGCGPGFASAYFRSQGLRPTGIDIAANCLLPEHVGLFPLITGPLWALPAQISADWGFCADVMEHIPEDRVDDVLRVISKSVRRSTYFNISFRPDGYGLMIGEVLHLTVRPKEWWQAKLAQHWPAVTFLSGAENDYGNFLVSH